MSKKLLGVFIAVIIIAGCSTLDTNPFDAKSKHPVSDSVLSSYSQTFGSDSIVFRDTIITLDTVIKDSLQITTRIDSIVFRDTVIYWDSVIFRDSLSFIDTIHIRDSITFRDTISYEDTVIFIDTVVFRDTSIVVDTTHFSDTLHVRDTIKFNDTLFFKDTTFFKDTLIILDTVLHVDSIRFFDTISVHDTIRWIDTVLSFDTLRVFDTTQVYDTTYFYKTVYDGDFTPNLFAKPSHLWISNGVLESDINFSGSSLDFDFYFHDPSFMEDLVAESTHLYIDFTISNALQPCSTYLSRFFFPRHAPPSTSDTTYLLDEGSEPRSLLLDYTWPGLLLKPGTYIYLFRFISETDTSDYFRFRINLLTEPRP